MFTWRATLMKYYSVVKRVLMSDQMSPLIPSLLYLCMCGLKQVAKSLETSVPSFGSFSGMRQCWELKSSAPVDENKQN